MSFGVVTTHKPYSFGAVAEALYGIPDTITFATKARLDPFLLDIINQFERRFIRRVTDQAGTARQFHILVLRRTDERGLFIANFYEGQSKLESTMLIWW